MCKFTIQEERGVARAQNHEETARSSSPLHALSISSDGGRPFCCPISVDIDDTQSTEGLGTRKHSQQRDGEAVVGDVEPLRLGRRGRRDGRRRRLRRRRCICLHRLLLTLLHPRHRRKQPTAPTCGRAAETRRACCCTPKPAATCRSAIMSTARSFCIFVWRAVAEKKPKGAGAIEVSRRLRVLRCRGQPHQGHRDNWIAPSSSSPGWGSHTNTARRPSAFSKPTQTAVGAGHAQGHRPQGTNTNAQRKPCPRLRARAHTHSPGSRRHPRIRGCSSVASTRNRRRCLSRSCRRARGRHSRVACSTRCCAALRARRTPGGQTDTQTREGFGEGRKR